MMIIKKAILKNFNSQNHTATIQINGSSRAHLAGITVALNIPTAEMIAGRRIAVVFWDKNNPVDAVVLGVY